MQLAVGDVLTLNVTARDTAGNVTLGDPVRVLIAPRAVGPQTYERLAETEAAAQWADALAGEIEAAAEAWKRPRRRGSRRWGACRAAAGRRRRARRGA